MSKIWFDGSIQFKKGEYVDQFGQELIVEGEWLNGVPHGLCIVEGDSLRGIIAFTKGRYDGQPMWVEDKGDRTRISYQYFDPIQAKGLMRFYKNDSNEPRSHQTSTTQKIPTPGWLHKILKIEPVQGKRLKQFFDNGDVREVLQETQIGWQWRLKEDGTHDKYELAVKYVPVCQGDKEGESEENGLGTNLEKTIVETFLCNEKLY